MENVGKIDINEICTFSSAAKYSPVLKESRNTNSAIPELNPYDNQYLKLCNFSSPNLRVERPAVQSTFNNFGE